MDSSMNSANHRASFLAASSQHSGDWLFALPIASCGLRLDDEAVRVAAGLRLGLDLCTVHTTPVPLRLTSDCPWDPQLRVQKSPGQVT